jgi:hemerythrin
MINRDNKFQMRRDDLENLDQEHSEIHRQYIRLDDAILLGFGSVQILEAARDLVHTMGLQFTQEQQFQEANSVPVLETQRTAGNRLMAEIITIAEGLKQGEVYAALRLRGLCRGWMHEHMYMEMVDLGFAALIYGNEPDRTQAQI